MRSLCALFSVVTLLAACGGGSGGSDVAPPSQSGGSGGSTVISSSNYLDAAAVAYVAASRLEFANDLIDAAFEIVILTSNVPGTYTCTYGGTVSYSLTGSIYTFTVSNCDTDVGGERILMPSGTMTVADPTVQTTRAGYFLTSAAVTLSNANFFESGAVSTVTASANLSSTVSSDTTAVGTTSGASMSVSRAGRTDSYTEADVTSNVDLYAGNTLTGGGFKLSSPRSPGDLTVAATTSSLRVTATDGSQAVLTRTSTSDYTIELIVDGVVQASVTGSDQSGPFGEAIVRALQ